MQARVYQLNVKKETLEERGIPKGAIETLKITKEGCEGDYNRYRTEKKQSDPHKAVMILTKEIIEELNKEGWPIEPGDLGENITLEGIPYEDLQPKTQIKIDKVLLEITQACTPCTNLRVLAYVGLSKTPLFIKTMLGRRGWYAKVLQEGTIKKREKIEVQMVVK